MRHSGRLPEMFGGGGRAMAQTNSNAQSEPSMEEILASIRRIIEDSDAAGAAATAQEAGSSSETPAQDTDAADAKAEIAEASETGEFAEVDQNANAPEGDGPGVDSEPAEYEHAEIAAAASEDEVRSFNEKLADDESSGEDDAKTSSPNGAEAPSADSIMSVLSLSDIRAEVAAGKDETEAAEEAPVEEVGEQSDDNLTHDDGGERLAESIVSDAIAEDSDSNSGARMVAEHMQTAAGTNPEEPRTPIISEHAGRKIAAAFDELSEAFSRNRQPNFDAMAEKMMRPMLRDWLDNNLPVLVERLVREEIDRVARSASR